MSEEDFENHEDFYYNWGFSDGSNELPEMESENFAYPELVLFYSAGYEDGKESVR
jgi:hypothetical protein